MDDLSRMKTFLISYMYASLPCSYNSGLAALSSMMHLHDKPVTSDDLMDIALEEYDRLMLQDGREKKSSGKDAAFGADASSKKGKWKGKCFGGDCNNCSWPGHKECNCWEEGGGKAGQAPKNWKSHRKKPKDEKSKKSSASANVTSTVEPDSAWFATLDSGSSTDDHIDVFLAQNESILEFYDSGASQHLSLCHEQFIKFVAIPPKPI